MQKPREISRTRAVIRPNLAREYYNTTKSGRVTSCKFTSRNFTSCNFTSHSFTSRISLHVVSLLVNFTTLITLYNFTGSGMPPNTQHLRPIVIDSLLCFHDTISTMLFLIVSSVIISLALAYVNESRSILHCHVANRQRSGLQRRICL
jgi:hypothetical protein